MSVESHSLCVRYDTPQKDHGREAEPPSSESPLVSTWRQLAETAAHAGFIRQHDQDGDSTVEVSSTVEVTPSDSVSNIESNSSVYSITSSARAALEDERLKTLADIEATQLQMLATQ